MKINNKQLFNITGWETLRNGAGDYTLTNNGVNEVLYHVDYHKPTAFAGGVNSKKFIKGKDIETSYESQVKILKPKQTISISVDSEERLHVASGAHEVGQDYFKTPSILSCKLIYSFEPYRKPEAKTPSSDDSRAFKRVSEKAVKELVETKIENYNSSPLSATAYEGMLVFDGDYPLKRFKVIISSDFDLLTFMNELQSTYKGCRVIPELSAKRSIILEKSPEQQEEDLTLIAELARKEVEKRVELHNKGLQEVIDSERQEILRQAEEIRAKRESEDAILKQALEIGG
ncbi:hypothetical protein L2712_12115 [Shewanella marisflavi]|uniref:hypothetical protein n=1 Tax=Shewanella marisflavi TaxID=260364 RepID=UPI00200C06DD|nr:hypothetical protein [Shewanella marisflavi]MCL1042383.1 hypothetical protein [Shewanella marisflavi]